MRNQAPEHPGNFIGRVACYHRVHLPRRDVVGPIPTLTLVANSEISTLQVRQVPENSVCQDASLRENEFATSVNTHDTSRKVIILQVGRGPVANRVPLVDKTVTSIKSIS
jgi:hypothetical protein